MEVDGGQIDATPEHFYRERTVFYDVAEQLQQHQQLRQADEDNAARSPSRRLSVSSPVFVPGSAAVDRQSASLDGKFHLFYFN